MTRNSFQFGSFTLDLERMCLRGPSGEVDLRRKSFDVLRFLLEHSDRIVTKEELISAIWPDVTVSDESLAQCISEIRRSLDDKNHQIVRTVPRRGYMIGVPVPASDARSATGSVAATLPSGIASAQSFSDRPAIAVLPFSNMSDDPGQEYFADGMADDIITGLSRSKSLLVIARTSTFTYKGKAANVQQIGRELGVRYVLEGSVRKAGDRIRVTGQLIDVTTGGHLWADRFDGDIEDVFDLQDRLTSRVINATSYQVERAEILRSQRKPTESLQAYDYFLRALANFYRITRETNLEALKLTEIASSIDVEFAAAHALGARCYTQRKAFGWSADIAHEREEARRLARRAVELDKDDPLVLAMAGHTLAYVANEVESGAALLARAISLDPNLFVARHWSGVIQLWLGDGPAAIEHFKIALRLSPVDPMIFNTQTSLAMAYFMADRADDALFWATTGTRQEPRFMPGQSVLVACLVLSGRVDEAREVCARVIQLEPRVRLSTVKDFAPYRRPQDMKKLMEAFRVAGMPE
jgi:adenylate cyclase